MIEAIMFFALGFLAASLIALVLLSAVWHRAVRLTTRRIEGAIPVSMAEIQADKDQLRAEFAMSTRRLETSVEQLKLKTTEQLAEIGRKSETIRLLKTEVEEKSASITALEAQERTLRERLRSTEEELSVKARNLHEAEAELSAKTNQIAQLSHSLSDKTSEAESNRVEIVALENQCITLKGRIAELEREVATTEERLSEQRQQADQTSLLLTGEREVVETLSGKLADLESRLTGSKAEAEQLSRTVADLESESRRQQGLAAQREKDLLAMIAARDASLEASAQSLDISKNEILSLHREVDETGRSYTATIESLKAEKSMLEGALSQLRDDRARLQQEVGQLKQEAETAWNNERLDSALLRERINDVAAEVARLAANLEGSDSPIERILAETPPPPPPSAPTISRQNGSPARIAVSGENGSATATAERPLSLAERIRALQTRSARS
jgi:chromosome segregation ATPase